LSDYDYPPSEIAVDWCVMARVKGKGKPFTNTTMGGGVEACNAMIDWLGGLAVEGERITVDIVASLTSEEVPGGFEKFSFEAGGLGEAAILYAQQWLAANGPLEGWGGGGS
jgi:hypothetical protein